MKRWILAPLAALMCTAAAPGLKAKDCPSFCKRSVAECKKMCKDDAGCTQGCEESSKMCPKMCEAMTKHPNDPARLQMEMRKVIEAEEARQAKGSNAAEFKGGKHVH
ncbi:MAG: hypothetical protein ACOX6T_09740 [Myxococcales bacterium]|jgi:hypothetical protein